MLSISCNSAAESLIRAKSSAYIGAPQYTPLIEIPRPEAVAAHQRIWNREGGIE